MIIPSTIALAFGGGLLIGRALMARAIAEHDKAFNANIRRLAFRIARAAYPKKEPTQ